jgi:hypothetical protein
MEASRETRNGVISWATLSAVVALACAFVFFGISYSQPTEFLLALSVLMMGVPVSLAPQVFGVRYKRLQRPLSTAEKRLKTIFYVGVPIFFVALIFRLATGIR